MEESSRRVYLTSEEKALELPKGDLTAKDGENYEKYEFSDEDVKSASRAIIEAGDNKNFDFDRQSAVVAFAFDRLDWRKENEEGQAPQVLYPVSEDKAPNFNLALTIGALTTMLR